MQAPSEIEPAYEGLQPSELWRHFSALNRIPRPSGEEGQARAYVQEVADSADAKWDRDDAGNTVVRLGATVAAGPARPVAVQAHLDMVSDKEAGLEHNFSRDPIKPVRDGDSVHASGTTLGADNGIGAAAALAVITTPGLRHGPLELLFTVNEERGLRGALALDPSLLTSRFLINLDTQDPRTLIVGSAGAQDTSIRLPITRSTIDPDEYTAHAIEVSGLRGGHSGMEIDEHRANALKLLLHLLSAARAAGTGLRIASLRGGTARNAIPPFARAEVLVPIGAATGLEASIGETGQELQREWSADEPSLAIQVEDCPPAADVLSDDSAEAVLSLLEQLPHGPLARFDPPQGGVKTSANLALVKTPGNSFDVLMTSRSFSEDDLREVQSELSRLASAAGGVAELTSGYPPWVPNSSNRELVSVTSELYEDVNGRAPAVELVHGGLECGVIAARVPGLQAISFGPLIRDAHTPREHVYASTVESVWILLLRLLERLASDEQRQAA